MAIGRLIRKRRLDTAISSSCVSACALIWAGGKTRTVDGRLSVHCPTLIGSPYSCDAPGRQQMIRYLQEMNAPAGVVRMQEATNWMAMTVTPAQLAEAPVAVAQAEEPQPEQVTEDAPRPPRRRPAPRYAAPPLPPPGVLYEPWTQRAVPCLPTLLTLGMVRFCI
jgi:hypothetical protein